MIRNAYYSLPRSEHDNLEAPGHVSESNQEPSRNYFSRWCYTIFCCCCCSRRRFTFLVYAVFFIVVACLFILVASLFIPLESYSALSPWRSIYSASSASLAEGPFQDTFSHFMDASDFFDAQGKCVSDTMRYMIIVDAGSSGSRLYIYAWHHKSTLASLPRFKPLWSIKISPGISSFVDHLPGLTSHIQYLFDFAIAALSHRQNVISTTPVYILCTGGMRLLNATAQAFVQSHILKTIQEQPAYASFQMDASHIRIISGELEGLYGWMALNYLMNRLLPFGRRSTVGFLDLGGASLQIAYEPESATWNSKTISISYMDGSQMKKNVSVTSLLGFGVREARNRYRKEGWQASEPRFDPCLPLEAKDPLDALMQGLGNFSSCQSRLLELGHRWLYSGPASTNHTSTSAILSNVPKHMAWIGISEFYNTQHDVFEMGGLYDPFLLESYSRQFCGRRWSSLWHQYSGDLENEPEISVSEKLRLQCFKSAWVLYLLHDRLGFPKERPPCQSMPLLHVRHVEEMAISWSLGAAIFLYHKRPLSNKQ